MPEWMDIVNFFSPSQHDTKNHSEYIKWSFSIGDFERYVNFKSDYLELLLSVYKMGQVRFFDGVGACSTDW